LQEWEHVYGISGITGNDYQKSLNTVAKRINVNENECAANPQNAALERGAEALGYKVGTIPRNVNGCQDCGFCNYGCRYGSKQSTMLTYLQDAAQHGARIIVQAEADRILIEAGQAAGVEATVRSAGGAQHQVTIKSKAVVASAGTLHTPALLIRSGLTNANIGQNLHLHPTSVTYGLYDQPVQGWSGVLMSRYVPQFNNQDGQGYGCTLETAPVHPGIASLVLPWSDGLQHKRTMSRIARMGNIIVITRDREGGYVSVDRQGKPVLHYTMGESDSNHLMHGILESLKIHHAAGALEVCAPHSKPLTFIRDQDPNFEKYLQTVQAAKLRKNGFSLLSAHQMSSARMAANPAHGVVDPTGEAFEVGNLFVADGSVLPTATGVNPMLTIMAMAHYIAQHVKAKLGK
jgi:choline dehydrogenase-like flavoprotein